MTWRTTKWKRVMKKWRCIRLNDQRNKQKCHAETTNVWLIIVQMIAQAKHTTRSLGFKLESNRASWLKRKQSTGGALFESWPVHYPDYVSVLLSSMCNTCTLRDYSFLPHPSPFIIHYQPISRRRGMNTDSHHRPMTEHSSVWLFVTLCHLTVTPQDVCF
jgi:hypothetical protein